MARAGVKLGFLRNQGSRIVANASLVFGAAVVLKVMDLVLIIMASRFVAFEAVGLAFLAESMANVVFALGDFGMRTVLTRRAARGQLDRATFARVLGLRGGVVTACLAAVVVAVFALAPEWAVPLAGFLLAWALFHVHDVGRAVLIGQERFALNAGLGIGARLVGTCVAIVAMTLGAGVLGWAAGKVAAEALHLCLVGWFSWRRLPRAVEPLARSVVREGIPFWSRHTVDVLNGHLEVLLVTFYLGLEGAAFFGLAGRILGGGLLVVGSISSVAFPDLARRQAEPIRWRQVWVIGLLALGMAVAIATIGPWVVGWLFAEWTASGDLTLRVLAVALLFITLYQPTAVWLEAHDREVRVLLVNLIALPISVVALVLLVPIFGAAGAAAAVGVRTLVQACGAIGQAGSLSRRLDRAGGNVAEAGR